MKLLSTTGWGWFNGSTDVGEVIKQQRPGDELTAPAGGGGSVLKSPAVDSIPELASSDDELDTASSEEDNGLSDSPAESTDICVSPARASVPVS